MGKVTRFTPEQKRIIKKTRALVCRRLDNEGTGHDWWHTVRVRNNALRIGNAERADMFIVELGALLHDVADWKFHSEKEGGRVAERFLSGLKLDPKTIKRVRYIVDHISFKGGTSSLKLKTLEAQVVRDADRLDALGAIGIARAFAMGGFLRRPVHVPGERPKFFKSKAAYKKYKGTTINHFYEKILKLIDLMHTKTGRKLARGRHKFVKEYLNRFYEEWEGKR